MSKPRSDWDKLLDLSKDSLVAFSLAFITLMILWALRLLFAYPPLWIFVWSPIPAFLIFDLLMSNFARGGSGIFQNPMTGKAMAKGHAFLLIFSLIFIFTILTAGLIDISTYFYENSWAYPPLVNFLMCVWLFLYLQENYYRHNP